MFKVTSEPKFTHDVTVQVPVDGGHREETFKATYLVVGIDEMTDMLSLDGQQKLLKRVVCQMDELEDEKGKPMPYSIELRDQLIKLPFVRAALYQTYLKAVSGAREGN